MLGAQNVLVQDVVQDEMQDALIQRFLGKTEAGSISVKPDSVIT